jgi:catechol 2,3-dioxygenase-like lactoylglutathione lyase family enzyme/transcriptional regulator with XRE-family HTH domain
MKFQLPLVVVSDMERSKVFYKKYLGLEVEVDFGANVTLTGGLALQTLDTWRGFIGTDNISFKCNAGELYFEEDDFDGFLQNLDGLELVHPPLEHSWGQRVVRFYDPDGHIIEVGENLIAVVRRFADSGMSLPEIAARMDVSEEYVSEWLSVKPTEEYGTNELQEAYSALSSTLKKCEKIEIGKLGKSQQTLLKRRIVGLKLALKLIEKERNYSDPTPFLPISEPDCNFAFLTYVDVRSGESKSPSEPDLNKTDAASE